MALHNDLGKSGESIAKAYLERKGYEILDENWCHKKAEVDLIAYLDSTIVFVEVKTRTGNWFGEPEDFVNGKKQKLLTLAANEYIHIMEHTGEIRFDIISVLFVSDKEYKLNHIEDAFWNY
mgnify:CR=1 FL=1